MVEPARRLAAAGPPLDVAQADWLRLLAPILTLTAPGRAVFAPQGRVLGVGERVRNPELAAFLAEVGAGTIGSMADAGRAAGLPETMAASGGLVTAGDLDAYRVLERAPLAFRYRGASLLTNPPPSFGGALVADGLASLAAHPPLGSSAADYVRLAAALVAMSERHLRAPASVRGTTHVSVVDAEGSVASLTTSNGSCAGVFVPGTGVQLNNVMGEADLHPDGFHASAPGIRVGSMMAPTVARTADGSLLALGSGGSARIRSALACVLVAVLDRGLSLAEAVGAPRLHWDRERLQTEAGRTTPSCPSWRPAGRRTSGPGATCTSAGCTPCCAVPTAPSRSVGDDRRCGAGRTVRVP